MNCFKFPKILLITAICSFAATQLRAMDSGWKFCFDVGPTWVQNQNIQTTDLFFPGVTHTTTLTFKTGYRLDLDAGYQFCRILHWKGRLATSTTRWTILSSSGTTYTSFYQVPILVNGVFTAPWFGSPVNLMPEAGLGAWSSLYGANDLRDFNGAGQIMAGLKCGLPAGMDVAVGYKLLVTTEHQWNDIIDTTEGTLSISQSIVAAVSIKF